MRRREFIGSLIGTAVAGPLAARAQQPAMPVIGFLSALSPDLHAHSVGAFRQGLRDLGYVEGKNIVVEFRWAEGHYDRLSDLAGELVRLKVDVLVTHGTPGTRAAKQATTSIPIVMAGVGDAVATGLVASLNRPGGNITGINILGPELYGKRLELLKDAFPQIRHIAYLFNPANLFYGSALKAMESVAGSLNVEVRPYEVRLPNEFENAFSAMVERRVDAAVVSEDAMISANYEAIAALAEKHRLPAIGGKDFPETGGLIGYGTYDLEVFRRAAYFVDRILRGAHPAELPVEQGMKIELVVNLKTAKALGITIPPILLERADEVIE
jgi:putative ABC transport system substrate-binding protein